MLGRRPEAGADHRADDHGHLGLAAEHVAQFSALVKDLVKADTQEVYEHQFGDRAQTRGGRTHSRTDEGRFADGGVEDPIASKLRRQSLGDAHNSAPGLYVLSFHMGQGRTSRDIFPEEDYGGVTAHFQPHGLVNRITKSYCTCCHCSSSFLLLRVVDINVG